MRLHEKEPDLLPVEIESEEEKFAELARKAALATAVLAALAEAEKAAPKAPEVFH